MAERKIKQVILSLDDSAAYARDITRGIAKYAALNVHWVFYRESNLFSKSISDLDKIKADGIIANASNRKIINKALKLNSPIVLVVDRAEDASAHKICSISVDGMDIGQMAAIHLLQTGINNFAFYGSHKAYFSERRLQGFREHLKRFDHCVHVLTHSLKNREKTRYDEVLEIAAWLKTLTKPVGIMAANDIAGQCVIQACKIIKAKVPEEIAVIGVDNDCSDPILCTTCN